MARPTEHVAQHFTFGEIALAGDLTVRQIEALGERGLVPDPVSGLDAGRSSARLFDDTAAVRAGIVSASVAAGFPLLAAGRLAHTIQTLGGYSPNKIANTMSLEKEIGFDKHITDSVYGEVLHLKSCGTLCKPMVGDCMYEIVDRSYVIAVSDSPVMQISGRKSTFSPWYRVACWDARGEVSVSWIGDEIAHYLDQGCKTDEYRAAARMIEDEFSRARENAIAIVRLNISLAIRKGYNRILAKRGVI